jgi:hypothetical protein
MDTASEDPILTKGYAYHEAGHAVADFHFGMKLLKIELPDDYKSRSLGVTKAEGKHPLLLDEMRVNFLNTPERAKHFSEQIMISLAGEAAQKRHCPESFRPEHLSIDRRYIDLYIREVLPMPYPNEREDMIQELYQKTQELLDQPKYTEAIHALAQALQGPKELTGEKATAIIREAMNRVVDAKKPLG